MSELFKVTLTPDEQHRVQVLELEGNFTLDEKREVDVLLEEITSSDYVGLVLDISKLTFIDSAGLMVVLAIFNGLRGADKRMAVATGGNAYPEAKMKETGLLRMPAFQAFESVEEARTALASGGHEG